MQVDTTQLQTDKEEIKTLQFIHLCQLQLVAEVYRM